MSYDPEKVLTSDEVTEFMSRLYEGLYEDCDLSVLKERLEARGIDTEKLVAKARALIKGGARR